MDLARRSLATALAASVCLSSFGIAAPALAAPRPLVAATAAPEGGGKLAILPLVVEGSLSEADTATLTQSLSSGLQRGEFTIVAPSEVLAVEPNAAGCGDTACFKSIASKTGAAFVVRAEVGVRDRDYTVQVDLVSGADGQRIARTQDGCEICGVVDVSGLIDSAAATLRLKLDALAKGPASIKLATDPPGAIITIDGDIAGTTPISRQIVPGKHLIRLTKEGYIAVEREVTFVEGVGEDLNFTLEKLPTRLPGKRWGYATIVLGIAGIGAGVALNAIDSRPYDLGSNCTGGDIKYAMPMPGQPKSVTGRDECKYLYNTKWYGIGAAVVGAALLTLGTVILINARPKTDSGGKGKARAERPGVQRLGLGPASVSLSGNF